MAASNSSMEGILKSGRGKSSFVNAADLSLRFCVGALEESRLRRWMGARSLFKATPLASAINMFQ